MSWKKNIRKIPKNISNKSNTIKNKDIVVGCVRQFTREDIQEGILSHLQIRLTDAGLQFPQSIIPPPEIGKHSSWNVNGREIIRRDLPKETHYNPVDAPNWGDSYYGTHIVDLPYEKYPRDYIAPRNSTIEIECANASPGQSHYIIKFQVSEVLNRDDSEFENRLFDCLNLLQENTGDCGIEEAGATLQDYIQTLHVAWDILPPGTVDEAVERLFAGKQPTQQERETVEERFNFFMSLNPQSLVFGRSGFQRYFGALLRDDLVVFENVEYGNAIYVMFDNWEELSQKSRIDLLSGKFGENFERVVHTGDWQEKVIKIIEAKQEAI